MSNGLGTMVINICPICNNFYFNKQDNETFECKTCKNTFKYYDLLTIFAYDSEDEE